MKDRKKPLVSILIPNYNYGRYLRHCLESVVNQTYENIEVIIQDNNSTDDSYDIIKEYEMKSVHKEIAIPIYAARNKRNEGSDRNCSICAEKAEGKYMMFLSSDDALKPDYVKRCVDIMEENNNVSMVMVHRDEIDDDGNLYETPPFYNKSFVVDGEAQAAVFMMAGIAVPTQVFFKREARTQTFKYRFYQLQVAGDWYSNFLMSCVGDIAYIKDALCEYRVHFGNETNESEKNLLGIFEHFLLVNAFNSTAKSVGFAKPQERYKEAIEKLGSMCLRYALKMIENNEIDCARRYMNLSVVLKDDIREDERYDKLMLIIDDKDNREQLLKAFKEQYQLNRVVSYEPPAGYIEIKEEKGCLI